jgi:diguanylate cyclase (GGDEF)-like protein/PAS domain S-box-containing protein
MLQSIRLRLLGLFVAATIPFMALIGTGLWQQWQREQAQALQLALSEARAAASLVDDHIGNLENLITGLSYAVSINPADAEQNDILFVRAKAAMPDYIANIVLFTLDGSNIGIAEGNRFSAADRSYFQKVLAGERVVIGEPVYGRATGRWIVTIARPIEDAAGKLRAVIGIGTSLEKFQKALAANGVPGAVVRLVNESSVVISEGISGPNTLGRDLVQFGQRVRHIAPRDMAEVVRWSDGVERITGSASSQRTRWVVSLGLPIQTVLEPVKTRMAWSALFCLAALTITLIVAWVIAGRTVRPLKQLARDAAILAEGDLGHRTAVRSTNEIGQLARNFNRMASALEQREDDAKGTAEEVRQTKDALAAVVDASPIGIVCTGLDRRIMLWNRAAEQIYGYTSEEAVGQAIKIVPPDAVDASRALYQRAINRETLRDVEVKRLRKDGTTVDIRLAVAPMYNPDGSVRAVAWAHEDITDRKRAEEQLRRFAHYDQLTELPNRLTMRKDLEALLAPDRRHEPVSIALFDLDGFKDVNDTLGHSTGDRLLIEVGRRLTAVAQKQQPLCEVCRLGGDEFVAIIPECGDPRIAADTVRAMLQVLAEPFELSEHVLHLAGSAGIAIAPNDGHSVDDLIANADLALYAAKKSGGGVYRFFVPSMRAKAQSRRALEIELRQAFESGEFEMFYQPQVKLPDRMVVGAEALLRWRHPDRGLLNPGLFIEALADNPIAPDVGRWITRTACMQAARWRAQGYALNRIAVNLFSAQLHDPMLVDDIERILQESGLPPHALELEIIENVALTNEASAKPLQRLHEKGVRLAFDDFGTGFASLSYLRLFPVSHIKIDRSFVDRVSNGAQDAAIVRSLIAMAHSLDLDVIAEGVETEEQALFLAKEGCDEGQGYLFAKPLSTTDFEAYLRNAYFSGDKLADPVRSTHLPADDGQSIARPLLRGKMR